MLCLNKTVQNWYKDRKVKNKLFNKYNNNNKSKYLVIKGTNIHNIVNLNTNSKSTLKSDLNNDIEILKSVRTYQDLRVYLKNFKLDSKEKRRYHNYKKWLRRLNKYKNK